MEAQFTAILERGNKLLVASCPELPEANGQGSNREEALRDLVASIRTILEFRRAEAVASAPADAETTFVVVS